jgi:hypothetical protein
MRHDPIRQEHGVPVNALADPVTFADERLPLDFLRGDIRAEPIAITPKTVQDILAYVAEKEQSLADLRGRVAELERLLEADELTGLLNRRGFETAAHRALAHAARYNETGVLALIDLDRFKHVNDAHGHAAGDAALRLIGQVLAESIRATDYAARLSGDEFAILGSAPALGPASTHRTLPVDSAVLPWARPASRSGECRTAATKRPPRSKTHAPRRSGDVPPESAPARSQPSNDISGA